MPKLEIEVEGAVCRVPLGGTRNPGLFAVTDTADLPLVAPHRWSPGKSGETYYPRARIAGRIWRLHAFLLRPAPGHQVRHRDGDGLNNRRSNLRLVSARGR